MRSSMLRRLCVLASAIFAIGMPFAQSAGILGLSPAEFSSSGDSTLRAATYAFAIWGLIYAGLLVYAVYQIVSGSASEAVLSRFGWPSVVSLVAIGVWLVAAANDWRWATVLLIALAAITLLTPLARPQNDLSRRDALLVVTPLALLAGWLTIATGLNTITVLTAEGVITERTATAWAVAGLAASVAIALIVYLRGRAAVYLLPVVWGLVAVFVAERIHRPEAAYFAQAAAIALTALAVWRTLSRRHKHARVAND